MAEWLSFSEYRSIIWTVVHHSFLDKLIQVHEHFGDGDNNNGEEQNSTLRVFFLGAVCVDQQTSYWNSAMMHTLDNLFAYEYTPCMIKTLAHPQPIQDLRIQLKVIQQLL